LLLPGLVGRGSGVRFCVSSVVTHKMSGVQLREREYLTRTM
jgi:hypothetical protein